MQLSAIAIQRASPAVASNKDTIPAEFGRAFDGSQECIWYVFKQAASSNPVDDPALAESSFGNAVGSLQQTSCKTFVLPWHLFLDVEGSKGRNPYR
eukprot:6111882-Amphidinium_carterae.1